MADKVTENYVRRHAARLGLVLQKSRGKKPKVTDMLGWKLIDPKQQTVLMGQNFTAFLDEIEETLRGYEGMMVDKELHALQKLEDLARWAAPRD